MMDRRSLRCKLVGETFKLNRIQKVELAGPRGYLSDNAIDLEFIGDIGQMSGFDKREEGFERKFAHDEELEFKAGARRNKLLGLWAAELMGISGDEADAYAKEVIKSDFEEAGDDDVFRKVRADFDAKGVDKSDHQLRAKMDELLAIAADQIQNEA